MTKTRCVRPLWVRLLVWRKGRTREGVPQRRESADNHSRPLARSSIPWQASIPTAEPQVLQAERTFSEKANSTSRIWSPASQRTGIAALGSPRRPTAKHGSLESRKVFGKAS